MNKSPKERASASVSPADCEAFLCVALSVGNAGERMAAERKAGTDLSEEAKDVAGVGVTGLGVEGAAGRRTFTVESESTEETEETDETEEIEEAKCSLVTAGGGGCGGTDKIEFDPILE